MKQFKFLRLQGKNIVSENGNEKWTIGEWKTWEGELKLCETGYHCSPTMYYASSYIQGEVLAEVETKGKKLDDEDKTCNESMKIVKAWKWTRKDSLSLAIYAAEKVLSNFEKEFPNDKRPREAIEAAKKVLFKDTKKNRDAVRSAAWSAESAARSVAWSAAWSAESAAWSAAWSAESAAWSAARSVAWSAARSVAWSAESAARSAAWSAAESAFLNDIEKWFKNRVKELEEIN